ncbi:MAG: GDSL family lipase [Clostridiales bacterium]|nr:GDSL family lipase [Clostridiales bacterium]
MRIMEKFMQKARDNWNAAPVTLAFLGDSVTQGCFELYIKNDGLHETVFDKHSAYHQYLFEMLNVLYPSVPVNIINAGVSGGSAPHGLERLERDVLSHKPDLVVVCFGLNDACQGRENLSRYLDALSAIFDKVRASGSDLIFMTPNMMGTCVSCHLTDPRLRAIAERMIPFQTEGDLDYYMDAVRRLCRDKRVTLCDCYAKWKQMEKYGVDTTDLLSNYINHPTRTMNRLFAVSLLETMMQEDPYE